MELEREDLLLDLAEPFTTADCDSLAVQEPFHEKFIDSVIYQSSQTVTIEDTYPTAKKFKPNKPEDFVSCMYMCTSSSHASL